MMRVLIILLVFTNIAYFAVEFLFGNAVYTSPAAIRTGIPAIELLKNEEDFKTLPAQSTRCYTVGPYNSEKAMKLVAKQLNAFGLAVTIRRQKTKDTLNYLVYLAAQESRQEALKIIDDIKKFDIENYHLIESGPYTNAISFGFFDDLNKARRHSEYIRYLGYDARYTEQKAMREIFWLNYDEQPDKSAPVLVWSRAVDSSSIVQRIPRRCEF
jgi:hypothetical protein